MNKASPLDIFNGILISGGIADVKVELAELASFREGDSGPGLGVHALMGDDDWRRCTGPRGTDAAASNYTAVAIIIDGVERHGRRRSAALWHGTSENGGGKERGAKYEG